MYEVRFWMPDRTLIDKFISINCCKEIKRFNFHDDYYRPINSNADWINGLTTIRIREIDHESHLLFSKYNIESYQKFCLVKNELGKKITLNIDNKSNAINMQIIKSLNFEYICTIKRLSGKVYEFDKEPFPKIEFTVEEIENYGLTTEIELNKEDIDKTIDFLEFFQSCCMAIPLSGSLLFDYLRRTKG